MRTKTKIVVAAVANQGGAMEPETIKNGASLKSLITSRGNIKQWILLFFVAFCISVTSAFAQDVIILKNGDEIQALVQEIEIDVIKYKKFDNPNGPNYTLKKSDVFMIRYSNGDRDVFTDNAAPQPSPTNQQNVQVQSQNRPLSSELYYNWFLGTIRQDGKVLNAKQVREVMSTNSKALQQYNTGMVFSNLSSISSIVWGSSVLWGMLSESETPWLIAVSAFTVMVPTSIVSWSVIGNSTKTYNSGLRNSASYHLNLGITPTGGVGLVMRF